MSLKKFKPDSSGIMPGQEVFLVTRDGQLLEGFCVAEVLFDLVSLDRPPLGGSEKQGFLLRQGRLRPNWCEGRRQLVGGYFSRQEAEKRIHCHPRHSESLLREG